MTSDFNDTTFLEYDDFVCAGDCAQAMCDDKSSSVLKQFREAILDQPFTLAVEVACCFVKYEDSGISQDRSCNRDSLSLTAR